MKDNLTVEKENLRQMAERNILGYIQALANDVTNFDDIGASQQIDGL